MDAIVTTILVLFLLPTIRNVAPMETLKYGQKDGSISVSDEKRLIKHLLTNYENMGVVGRPVLNSNDSLMIYLNVELIQILDLDEKNQILTSSVWNHFNWTDIFLKWNPTDFGNIVEVRVPVTRIWTPDIVLYNYADPRLKELRDAMAVIKNNGEITWMPTAIYKSTCSIDITNFPYDQQKCCMKFGSWTYDGLKLNITFPPDTTMMATNTYLENNEWKLLNSTGIRNIKQYSCCPEPYYDLTYVLRLKRSAAFYDYVLVIPCVLLSLLTLVIFWLPPESPAKMMLGMNIFVAFFLLLLLLADSTPPASTTIPLIGAYFCLNMILITLSTFLSVIVIQIYFHGEKKGKAPPWLKKLMFEGLTKLVCMGDSIDEPVSTPQADQTTVESASSLSPHRRQQRTSSGGGGRSKERPVKRIKCPELKYNKFQPQGSRTYDEATGSTISSSRHGGSSSRPSSGRTPPDIGHQHPPPEGAQATTEADVKEIKRILRSYVNRLQEKDSQARVGKEWRIIARTLDRLFFFMYLATIIISLATIFPKSDQFQFLMFASSTTDELDSCLEKSIETEARDSLPA